MEENAGSGSSTWAVLKTLTACVFFYSAYITWSDNDSTVINDMGRVARRQLSVVGDEIPGYMESLMKDLRERQKLFEETPPEEVKYWFEYTGPLQVSTRFGC